MTLPCHGEPSILRVASVSSHDARTTLALTLSYRTQLPFSVQRQIVLHCKVTLCDPESTEYASSAFPSEEPYCVDLFFRYISIFYSKVFFLRKM